MTVHTRAAAAVLAAILLAAGPSAGQESEVPVPSLLEPDVLLSVGRLVEGDLDPQRVVGSSKEGEIRDRTLTVFDRIYVPPGIGGRRLEPGDRVRTFRIGRIVDDPVRGTSVGRVLHPTGVARVEEVVADVAVAVIERAYGAVTVGDGVERVETADTTFAVVDGAAPGALGYLLGFQGGEELHPPYEVVFLRLPSAAAATPGTAVEIFHEGEVRDGRRFPDVRIARAMVVRTSGDVATAILYDVRRSDAAPGDPFRTVEPEP